MFVYYLLYLNVLYIVKEGCDSATLLDIFPSPRLVSVDLSNIIL